MKIMHVAETIQGGIATILDILADDQIARTGVKVIALIPDTQASFLAIPTIQTCTFRRSRRSISSLLALSLRLVKLTLSERPDVVHLHSTFAGFVGRPLLYVLRPLHKTNVVYCPHGWSFAMGLAKWKYSLYAKIENLLSKACKNIVCISQHEYDLALKIGIPEEKLKIIRNGIPITNHTFAPPLSVAETGSRKTEILFVGRLDKQKGIDIAMDAVNMLDPALYHLTVVGSSVINPKSYTPNFENMTFVGWSTKDELSKLYSESDVLIMPSRWEGFGLVAAESISFGTPVLASRIGGITEIVVDGVTGKLVPLDAVAFATALNRTSLAEWRSMRDSCMQHARANLSSKRMTEETWNLYRTSVAHHL
jgi:glycosyltransferase involved in cell wall biosynthesis